MGRDEQNGLVEESEKVVSLFGTQADHLPLNNSTESQSFISETLEDLDTKAEALDKQEFQASRLVLEDQFPDQSMFILADQMEQLKTSLSRLKFYLGELEDVLP